MNADVTPGLVCAHHHLYSALARGMPAPPTAPTTFLGVLEQIWWRLDTALDLEMLEWSAKLGALEALEAGCTAIVDHHDGVPPLNERSCHGAIGHTEAHQQGRARRREQFVEHHHAVIPAAIASA